MELAFDRCENPAGCDHAPDAICLKCGALSCSDHRATEGEHRRCAACGGTLAELLTGPIDLVLDARFRRG